MCANLSTVAEYSKLDCCQVKSLSRMSRSCPECTDNKCHPDSTPPLPQTRVPLVTHGPIIMVAEPAHQGCTNQRNVARTASPALLIDPARSVWGPQHWTNVWVSGWVLEVAMVTNRLLLMYNAKYESCTCEIRVFQCSLVTIRVIKTDSLQLEGLR